MRIRLTKISDDKFNGEHPNKIYAGNTYEGDEMSSLEVGYPYMISTLTTSPVTEIVNENTFKTRNSTYKREVIN